jgi:hypothetical protein
MTDKTRSVAVRSQISQVVCLVNSLDRMTADIWPWATGRVPLRNTSLGMYRTIFVPLYNY